MLAVALKKIAKLLQSSWRLCEPPH